MKMGLTAGPARGGHLHHSILCGRSPLVAGKAVTYEKAVTNACRVDLSSFYSIRVYISSNNYARVDPSNLLNLFRPEALRLKGSSAINLSCLSLCPCSTVALTETSFLRSLLCSYIPDMFR